jgi:hypothetical protein
MESGRVIVAGVDDSPVGNVGERHSAKNAGRRIAVFARAMVIVEKRSEMLTVHEVRRTSSALESRPTLECCRISRFVPEGG